MRKRDQLRGWLVGAKDRDPPSPTKVSQPVQNTASLAIPVRSSSSLTRSVSTTPADGVNADKTRQNQALQRAIEEHIITIPSTERDGFITTAQQMTNENVVERVRSYDREHQSTSGLRQYAEPLSRVLNLLDRFTNAIATGIQANPDVSSIIVGAARGVITMVIGFVEFFDKLSQMIERVGRYLEPLANHARSMNNSDMLEECLVNTYVDYLRFFRSARNVFIDGRGDTRKWTSWRVFWRLQWIPFEQEFGNIEASIKHHLDVLIHASQSIILQKSLQASQDEQERRRRELANERENFLRWLSSYPFEDTHERIYAKKYPETGDWLIRRPEFKRWFTAQHSTLLWCYAGAGKSVLAANVLEYVSSQRVLEDDVGIVFVYYSYQTAEMQEDSFIICAMIKQLCRQSHIIPEDFVKVKKDDLPQSQLGNIECLLRAIEQYRLREVFFVVDALDECPKAYRAKILLFIRHLLDRAPYVKVFATSRQEPDIQEAFGQIKAPRLMIEADHLQADIYRYVSEETRRLITGAPDGRRLYLNDPTLETDIINSLTTRAQGMFLWVNLQLLNLCEESKSHNDDDVRRALSMLPDGLEETYIRNLSQMCHQNEHRRRLAFRAFRWVFYADRILSPRALQLALMAEEHGRMIGNHQLVDIHFLLSTCANLLEISHRAVRPIHYSVKEFFTSTLDPRVQGQLLNSTGESIQIQSALTETCLKYLTSQLINMAPWNYSSALYTRIREDPFLWYAAQSFDVHLMRSGREPALIGKVQEVLQLPGHSLASMLQIRAVRYTLYFSIKVVEACFDSFSRQTDAIMIIFSSKLFEMRDFESYWKNRSLDSALLFATCSSGLLQAASHLLHIGIDVNSVGEDGASVLCRAALSGNEQIVQLLVDNGANVNAAGGLHHNALQWASTGGNKQVVKLLIDNGANVNVEGGQFGSALHAATMLGHKEIVQLLIDSGAEVDVFSAYTSTPIRIACNGGHAEIVQLLIDKGADPNGAGGEIYCNVLQVACANSRPDIVQILIDNGADINASGGTFGSALDVAVSHGQAEIANLLRRNGAREDPRGAKFDLSCYRPRT